MPKPLALPWKTYDTFKAALEAVDMVNRREKQPMRVWVCRTGDPGRLLNPVGPGNGGMRERFHRLIVRPMQKDGTPNTDDRTTCSSRWGAVVVLYHEHPDDCQLEIEQVDQVNLEPYQCWEEVWR